MDFYWNLNIWDIINTLWNWILSKSFVLEVSSDTTCMETEGSTSLMPGGSRSSGSHLANFDSWRGGPLITAEQGWETQLPTMPTDTTLAQKQSAFL